MLAITYRYKSSVYKITKLLKGKKEGSKITNFPNVVKVLRMFVYLIFLVVVHFVLLCFCLFFIVMYILQRVQRSFVDFERVCALQPIHSTNVFSSNITLYFLHRQYNVATPLSHSSLISAQFLIQFSYEIFAAWR